MEVMCGERLYIDHPTPALRQWCREHLRLDNPDYYKLERLGKWTGNTPKYFDLYETRGDKIVLPFGCAVDLQKAFDSDMRFTPMYFALRAVDYRSNIKLYPYQEKAVESLLRAKNGVLVMPCGSGKTQTALELVARIGGRCLWLTHTQDLLTQSMARAKAVLDVGGWTYGTITGGKVDIGAGITFATVQTMSKLNLSQYTDIWDIVIVDECHHAIGSPTRVMQFYKVLSAICCRYKYGLTATPKRADGLEKAMYALLGGVVHEVTREDVAQTTCSVKVETLYTDWTPSPDAVLAGDGTLNYAALIDELTHAKQRFKRVFDTVFHCKGHPTIVLANRVEYLRRLEDALAVNGVRVVCLSAAGNSKAAKEIRKKALRQLDAGGLDCILATYQLAKEGLDVPHLEYIIFATPEKDESTVTQAAGRVGRRAEGKKFGTVVDFVDDFGMLRGWAKKRQTYYKKLGYEIT